MQIESSKESFLEFAKHNGQRHTCIFSHKIADGVSIPDLPNWVRGEPPYRENPIAYRIFRSLGPKRVKFLESGISKDFCRILSHQGQEIQDLAWDALNIGITEKNLFAYLSLEKSKQDWFNEAKKAGVDEDFIFLATQWGRQMRTDFIEAKHLGMQDSVAIIFARESAKVKKNIRIGLNHGFDPESSLIFSHMNLWKRRQALKGKMLGLSSEDSLRFADLNMLGAYKLKKAFLAGIRDSSFLFELSKTRFSKLKTTIEMNIPLCG